MSLIPKHKSEDDFILWLADFIDRITIDTSKISFERSDCKLSSLEKFLHQTTMAKVFKVLV